VKLFVALQSLNPFYEVLSTDDKNASVIKRCLHMSDNLGFLKTHRILQWCTQKVIYNLKYDVDLVVLYVIQSTWTSFSPPKYELGGWGHSSIMLSFALMIVRVLHVSYVWAVYRPSYIKLVSQNKRCLSDVNRSHKILWAYFITWLMPIIYIRKPSCWKRSRL